MAKALVFSHGTSELSFTLEKVERADLYGYVDVDVQDGAGKPCQLAILSGDGRTLVGRGGSALAMLDPDGGWLERKSLRPIGADGEPLAKAASSFAAPVPLQRRATIDEYLSHNVKAVYLLVPPMGGAELMKELGAGAIYTFPFSFRGGLNPDVGFLLCNSEGKPFLAVGRPTKLRFLSLPETVDPEAAVDLEEEAEDDDAMDFGMM